MKELPKEQQLFYSQTGEKSTWISSVCGKRWPDEKCDGWLYAHLTWDEFQAIVNPTPTTDELRQQCKQNLASKRWGICQAGVLIDGVEVQSDKDSKDEMSDYVTESIVNGLVSVNWKRGNGEFSVYTVQQFKKIYQLVAKYRNDCFGVEMAKLAEIDAANDPTTVDIETGWPNREFTTV